MSVTEAQAAKAYQTVRTMISAQRFMQPIGLREIRVDAETFATLEQWERKEAQAMHKPYDGIWLGKVQILPPLGWQSTEDAGNG